MDVTYPPLTTNFHLTLLPLRPNLLFIHSFPIFCNHQGNFSMPEDSLVNLSFNDLGMFEKSHKFSIKYSFNNRKSAFSPSSVLQIKTPHLLKSNLATHKFSYRHEILPHLPYCYFFMKNST